MGLDVSVLKKTTKIIVIFKKIIELFMKDQVLNYSQLELGETVMKNAWNVVWTVMLLHTLDSDSIQCVGFLMKLQPDMLKMLKKRLKIILIDLVAHLVWDLTLVHL